MAQNIAFLAVARAPDNCVVACHAERAGEKDRLLRSAHEVLGAPDFAVKAAPRRRLRLVSDATTFNFMADTSQRVYIAVTSKAYPERVVFALIEELQTKFLERHGDRVGTATEDSMSKPAAKVFRELVDKYDNPANVDKLASVHGQVQAVTEVMQGNVRQLLSNIEQTEQLVEDTADLRDKAGRYRTDARVLKNKMKWRRIKMTILITLVVLAILAVIIVPIVVSNS